LVSPSSPTSYYALLEVPQGASEQELRQAFRSLSKRYHPDTTSLPPAEAETAFRRLREAYAVLSDPEQRRRYDALLAALRLLPPSAPAGGNGSGPTPPPVALRPDGVRRALSGGEWLALLLLAMALVLSLALGVGLAWMRGAELMAWPSWWPPS
jgi:DnaJ-domain-containing protein 1